MRNWFTPPGGRVGSQQHGALPRLLTASPEAEGSWLTPSRRVSLAYQFAPNTGKNPALALVIDEASNLPGCVADPATYNLFARLGLQLLIVTSAQKVHVITHEREHPADNPDGRGSRVHADRREFPYSGTADPGWRKVEQWTTSADLMAKVQRCWNSGSLPTSRPRGNRSKHWTCPSGGPIAREIGADLGRPDWAAEARPAAEDSATP
jgi:hypothetical protein